METKKYYAKELSIVMDQVKAELGNDAIIVKSRKTRKKGILGLFQKPIYEVVVSYDPESIEKRTATDALKNFGRDLVPLKNKPNDPAAKKTAKEKTATPKVQQAAPPSAAPQQAQASPSAVFAGQDDEDDPQAFAELIRLAQEIEPNDYGQPAWVTPATKLGAYINMRQTPPQDAAPEQRATVVSSASVQARPYLPPEIDAEEDMPARRGRGRPRKVQEQEEQAPVPAQAQYSAQEDPINSRLDVVEDMLRSLMDAMRQTTAATQTTLAPQAPGVPGATVATVATIAPGAPGATLATIAPGATIATVAPGAAEPEEYNFSEERVEMLRIWNHLVSQDVDGHVADALMETAMNHRNRSGMRLISAVELALSEVLGKPRYLRGSTKTARTVMLIGPTGVGKTTTLVKLAAGCIFERKAKVAIINADVFRVGAQDQLNAYAKILDVPLKTIYRSEDLPHALDQFSDMDFIFIDTAGKPSGDKDYQAEIRQLIKHGKVQDTYLVVSSTTSGRVCRQIIESYSFIPQYKTILTKVDESGSFGGAVNLCYYSAQPLSYVTIGQNVPDDIERADVDQVVEQLMR